MKHRIEFQILFSAEIKEKLPSLKIGLLQASPVIVKLHSEIVKDDLEKLLTFIREKFNSAAPADDEIISNVRRMYRRIGWEPTRYRPSSEAMIRRILKTSGLYSINNLVDLGNITSTRFHLPLGLYDMDRINGLVMIDVGKENETYEGLSNPLIHARGKMVLRDEEGIFGNPTADSKRTCISNTTTHIGGIFFTPPEVSDRYLTNTLNYLGHLYQMECPGSSINTEIYEAVQ